MKNTVLEIKNGDQCDKVVNKFAIGEVICYHLTDALPKITRS